MTDEERIDQQRAAQAYYLARNERPDGWTYDGLANPFQERIGVIAARLAREGWTPTDPDLVLARGVVAKYYEGINDAHAAIGVCEGREDAWSPVQIALAAIRAARGEGK